MDDYELEYQNALSSVENSIVQAIAELEIPAAADLTLIEKCSSSLDAWDYCYAIAIGLAGVFISTNEAFAQYLDQIHKAASDSSGEYDRFQHFWEKRYIMKGIILTWLSIRSKTEMAAMHTVCSIGFCGGTMFSPSARIIRSH